MPLEVILTTNEFGLSSIYSVIYYIPFLHTNYTFFQVHNDLEGTNLSAVSLRGERHLESDWSLVSTLGGTAVETPSISMDPLNVRRLKTNSLLLTIPPPPSPS